MDKANVLLTMEILAQLFKMFQIPANEVTYQALVETAEWLRAKRNFAVHTPELKPLPDAELN